VIGRALARQVAWAFGIALPAGALLVTGLQALRLSPIAAAARASASEWAGALGAAALLGVEPVAPAAFAVAVVLVALRWQGQGELLAARAAGLSPLRLAGPSMAVVLAATLLLALCSVRVAPLAARHLARTWEGLLPRAIAGAVRPGAMVEVVPGLEVYAARRRAGGTLEDVVVAYDGAVLAARVAEVRVAEGSAGPRLVVQAERGALARGAARAGFERLVLPVDLGEAVASRRGAIGSPGEVALRGGASASFCLVALAALLASLLGAARPATLVLSVAALVAVRELAARAFGPQGGAVTALGGGLPVLVLVPPLVVLALLAARRDAVLI